MQTIISALCIGLSIAMLYSSFGMMKRVKKNKKIQKCVIEIETEETFFQLVQDNYATFKDEEYLNKMRIIDLWGSIQHQKMNHALDLLEQIDFRPLIINPKSKNKNNIQLNEDSFYYYCFATFIRLWEIQDFEMMEKLNTKLLEASEYCANQRFYQLFLATYAYYHGEYQSEVFKEVLNNDRPKEFASTRFIDIYQNISACFIGAIGSKLQDEEMISLVKNDIVKWNATKFGERIIHALKIEDLAIVEEIAEEEESSEENQA